MNNTQESSADIIAEMRKDIPRVIDANTILRNYADRLEAAIKREKAAIEADALAAGGIVEAKRHKPGNGAALREALECIDSIAKYLEAGTIRDVQHAYRNIQDRVRIAPAAPPRNCDRFATVKDAAIAFARERQDAPHPCPGFTFSAWLFEPAMEKEAVAKWNIFAKRVAPGETKGADGE